MFLWKKWKSNLVSIWLYVLLHCNHCRPLFCFSNSQLHWKLAFQVDLLCAYSSLIERNESLTNSQIVRSIKQTINNSFAQHVATFWYRFMCILTQNVKWKTDFSRLSCAELRASQVLLFSFKTDFAFFASFFSLFFFCMFNGTLYTPSNTEIDTLFSFFTIYFN